MRKQFTILLLLSLITSVSSQDKVGININSPQFALDIRSLLDDNPAELHLSNPSNTRFLRLFNGSNTFPHPSIFWKDAHHLRFATDAGGFSEKMRILSNGNVGIGEITPIGLLHIKANSTIPLPHLRLTENDNDFARIKMEDSVNTGAFWDLAGKADINAQDAIFNFYFQNSSGGSDKMSILGNGNVGIGTTSPNVNLQIGNATDVDRKLKLAAGSSTVARIDLQESGNSGMYLEYRGADNRLDISGRNIGTDNLVPNMTITRGGRIGISSSAPEYQLDIRQASGSTVYGELNIGTFTNSHFVRLQGGENGNPSPKMIWNNNNDIKLGSSNPDGSNFKEFLRLDGRTIGVYNTGGSVFIGEGTGIADDGSFNYCVGIGSYALNNNQTNHDNVAIGSFSLYSIGSGSTSGSENTAVGGSSGNMSQASSNTYIGFGAGRSNVNGSSNTFLGTRAGYNSTSSQNILIGAYAGHDCTGSQNIFMGDHAGSDEGGTNNLYLGLFSGSNSSSGNWNVYLGNSTGYNNISGKKNVIIGHAAGLGVTGDSFDSSVMIGYEAGKNNIDDNRLYIENSSDSSPLIYGEFDNNLVKVHGEFKSTNSIEVTNSLQVLKAHGKNIIEYNPVFGGILTWGSQTDWNLFPDEVKIGGTTNFSPNSNLHITDPTEPSIVLQTGEGVGNTTYWKIRRNSVGSLQWHHSTFHKMTLESAGNLGLGIENPNVRLDVSGSIEYTGSITNVSDIRLKKNIQDLPSVADELEDIRAVSYEMRKEEFPEMNFEEGREYGVIAQELEPLFPELVKTDPDGYKSVDYTKLTVVLLKATQEQQQMIEDQKAMIDLLMKKINNLEQAGNSN
ncbi:MAG: tail fiber domain-containing protein [Saprospiraceae bacterium]|nr:tail fiber domain-containing protein [Saprospiraceae bacterium]